jgi:glutathione synthase/RimK-type ligase-like ATP-grasp enzyme
MILQEFPPLEIESIKEKEKILRKDIDDLRYDILYLNDNEKEKQKELSDQIALKKKELIELGKKKKELQKQLEKLETDVICFDKVLPMMVFAILIDQLMN